MKTNCQLRIGAAKPTATVAETLTETETADNIRLYATLRPVGWELCTEECPKPKAQSPTAHSRRKSRKQKEGPLWVWVR